MPEGIPIETVWKRLQQTSTSQEQLPDAFLVRHVETRAAKTGLGTIVDDGERSGEGKWLCYPIVRREESPYRMVSIGRTPNNDIVIADASVSKFHAYFRTETDLRVWDGGSTNGSTINDRKVPTRDHGEPPLQMNVGDVLRVGSVPLTLMDAKSILDLQGQLGYAPLPKKSAVRAVEHITVGQSPEYDLCITLGALAGRIDVLRLVESTRTLPTVTSSFKVCFDLSALGDAGLEIDPKLFSAATELLSGEDLSSVHVVVVAATAPAAAAVTSVLRLVGLEHSLEVLNRSPFDLPSTGTFQVPVGEPDVPPFPKDLPD